MKKSCSAIVRLLFGKETFLYLLIFLAAGCVNYEAANRHYNFGAAYVETRQYTLALKELLEAEKNNPRDPKIHYLLAICYQAKGLPGEAAKSLNRAISLKSDYSDAHNLLGTIYLEEGKVDEAISEFQRALSNLLYETPSYALNGLGWAYYKKGDYPAALGRFQEIIDREPNSPIMPLVEKNMGIVCQAMGRYDESLKHLRRSLEIAPEFAPEMVRHWIGKALLAKGDRQGAEAEFLKSIQAAPNSQYANDSAKALENIKKQEAAAAPAPVVVVKPPASLVVQAPPAVEKKAPAAPPVIERPAMAPAVSGAPPPVEAGKPPVSAARQDPPASEKKPQTPAPAAAMPEKTDPRPATGKTGTVPAGHPAVPGEMKAESPVGAPASKSAAAPKTPALKIHTVRQGETMYSIARLYGISVPDLARANNLPAAYRVKVGEGLEVPGGEPREGKAPEKKPRVMVYKVKAGDSLTSVARKFNTTIDEIKRTNKLKSSYLVAGQLLNIKPGK